MALVVVVAVVAVEVVVAVAVAVEAVGGEEEAALVGVEMACSRLP